MSGRLKDLLGGALDSNALQQLVGSYDVVGDIAIILVPPGLVIHEQRIAAAILTANRRIKVVAKRDGNYGGEYRTIPLRILAGERRLETEVREFGVRLRLNPAQVYYSVRSGNERRRIASLVRPGERILALFSGIAPYPLILSRYSAAAAIVGIEKNPLAHRYAEENLRLNQGTGNIDLYCGDAREVLPALGEDFHRLLMPLPTQAAEFLAEGLAVLQPGGVLHFYALCRQGEFARSMEMVAAAARAARRQVSDAIIVRCGHCGPRTYRICVDARIE
jgi:tRNA (guanine37-N1)-methyltransferase